MSGRTYKQLSREERIIIESSLATPDIKLKVLAAKLGRDPKSIRYEITHHRQLKIRSNQKNKCGLQNDCCMTRLCPDCITGTCRFCGHDNCNEICPSFTTEPSCARLKRWPYVCAGCNKVSSCKLPKYFYYADEANREHIHLISDWKEGPRLKEKDMAHVCEVIQDGINKKQCLDVIIHENDLPISVATAYRYIDNHYIPDVKNIDLKRKSRYRTRDTSKPKIVPKNHDWLEGRRLTDYEERIMNDPCVNVWQMDTVIGKKGSNEKCVLTLLYTKTNLQLYFLMDHCDSVHVNKVFDRIKNVLGAELFKDTFTVILTDNGQEFHEPLLIETDPQTGDRLINVYFCNPRHSEEKAKCEKNHEHFRDLVPKGKSMNTLSQHDMNYVSNMINNYPRKSLGYKTPLELSEMFLNKKVLSLNNLKHVPLAQVDLTPIIK